ncbi:FAD-binding oxidoreductase [Defluviimonas sp. WL0024]|uniref:FAD-binding oxidoreductase n=2 Tax=Albidovulum TaxID=205889 RepID=A0ABT3J767_9RHOB|nr:MULTISPECIES: FAD-binding oxidoreductase [Defluviimonas]MCU9847287.1 FAD-binding oxidoreductase [Defluviimonas sp. WL0024]MCW3783508.1 FAD-binding oxidoreductase [Defluviimonas salinarum]
MTLIERLAEIVGPANVLTGADTAPYRDDWTGRYWSEPRAVLRPATTAEVAAILRLASVEALPVVPAGGRTGLTGGTEAEGALMLSLERMNRIRAIRPEARTAVVEAGVILSTLHDATAALDLYFPLWFGARGSATIGGALSTNAGGSNVLRYGSTRALCLGLEVVLADGRVMDLMSELHKDNSGYDLKDLFIGAEGTLGVITAAVMKLVPAPRAHATAMLAAPSLTAALALLNRLQHATGGLVEAFEFMPRDYMEQLRDRRPDLGQPFAEIHDVTILVELGATAPRDTDPGPDGSVPLTGLLEETLGAMLEEGLVLDAVIATSEAQRAAIWARREAAAEIATGVGHAVDLDVALPLDRVETFLARLQDGLHALAPCAVTNTVGHLGDGNIHLAIFPGREDAALDDRITEAVEDIVADLGGSFSAEHGIGRSKLGSMRRRKDPVALDMMRAVKAAFDPKGILNPGKTVPESRA